MFLLALFLQRLITLQDYASKDSTDFQDICQKCEAQFWI